MCVSFVRSLFFSNHETIKVIDKYIIIIIIIHTCLSDPVECFLGTHTFPELEIAQWLYQAMSLTLHKFIKIFCAF
jgi:hypothetical protein